VVEKIKIKLPLTDAGPACFALFQCFTDA